MTFVDVHWHGPAWVIFLTIPLVEVIIVQLSKWWNGRKGDACKEERRLGSSRHTQAECFGAAP